MRACGPQPAPGWRAKPPVSGANAPVSQQVVQHLTSGRNTNSKSLVPIAKALGVSLEWLARGGERSLCHPAPRPGQ